MAVSAAKNGAANAVASFNWSGLSCEVQSPTFEGENPRFGLNWLCLAMTLVEALF
jgi:hypothetical protein